MVELKGSLEGIGLPAIVQLVTELHHSGTLELTHAETTGLLGFDDGRLVSAVIDELRGLDAVRDMTQRLRAADFRFVEGRASGERNLDLPGVELQRQLARFAATDDAGDADRMPVPEMPVAQEMCPRLGLADDPTRNRPRPTALHRCYASIAPSMVTIDEQRELCLSGRFALCPRFRSASRPRRMPNGAPRVERALPTPLTPPEPSPLPIPIPSVDVPREPTREPLASPLVSASELPSEPREPIAPMEGPTRPPLSRRIPAAVITGEASSSSRPLPIVFATLAVGALAVLGGGAYLLARTTPPSPRAASPTPAVQAFDPVPTRPAVASALPAASPVPSATVSVAGVNATTVLPTAASPGPPMPGPPAPVPPAPVSPAAAGAAAAGRTLVDVRFATGVPSEWTQNPPYVHWADGAYRLRALQAARFVALGAPLLNPPADVLVSATFRKTGGPPGGGYGIVLRESSPATLDGTTQTFSGYVLETGDRGEFGIWRRDGDRWSDLVPWTRSAVVRVGGSPNDLVARVQGQAISFTVNGLEVANVRDSTLRSGSIGLFVGGDFNEVALDHFAVQALTP